MAQILKVCVFFAASLLSFDVAADNDTSIEPSQQLRAEHRGASCDCMEYWGCINRGGNPYSYCGLDESSVCCVFPTISDAKSARQKCGVKGFDSGSIGAAEPSEWPWQVAIVEDPGFYYVCGGSLVDESWILTAAHCVQSYVNQTELLLKVRLGEFDVSSSSESSHEDRNVSSIVLHPQYDRNALHADIALLRLESPATQKINVDAVCIPQQNAQVDSQSPCFVTGWGKTTSGGEYSKVLKEIFIPVWDTADCERSLQRLFDGQRLFDVNSTLCAGAPGHDACHGDGGSPLVCQENGQWFQHGLVSYGFSCGENSNPGVYTRISSFSKWLQATILSPPGT